MYGFREKAVVWFSSLFISFNSPISKEKRVTTKNKVEIASSFLLIILILIELVGAQKQVITGIVVGKRQELASGEAPPAYYVNILISSLPEGKTKNLEVFVKEETYNTVIKGQSINLYYREGGISNRWYIEKVYLLPRH